MNLQTSVVALHSTDATQAALPRPSRRCKGARAVSDLPGEEFRVPPSPTNTPCARCWPSASSISCFDLKAPTETGDPRAAPAEESPSDHHAARRRDSNRVMGWSWSDDTSQALTRASCWRGIRPCCGAPAEVTAGAAKGCCAYARGGSSTRHARLLTRDLPAAWKQRRSTASGRAARSRGRILRATS